MNSLRCLLLCSALLAAGCYDSPFGERGDDGTAQPVTTTIRELHEAYNEVTGLITANVIVDGIVTTSDLDGNFYRTLCIENDGAAIEVMAGLDHLHNSYPVGCHVTLRIKGLAMGTSYGLLQVGRMPAAGSGFATDYLGSKASVDKALTRNGEALNPIAPKLLTLPELSKSACGTLIRIDGLQYLPDEESENTWSGYRCFTDEDGQSVYTYVRAYADFAEKKIPLGKCSLTGILQQDASGGRFIVKLRYENDYAY